MRKTVAIAGITVSLLGGAMVGAAVMPVGISGAQDAPAEAEAEGGGDHVRDPGARIAEVISTLVADGTITQAQSDAVVAALVEARPEHAGRPGGPGGPDKPGKPGGPSHPGRPGHDGAKLDAMADLLGLDAEELGAQLRDGATLAEIAAANGVSTDDLIAAMVAAADARLAEAVEAGKITQEKADEIREGNVERFTAIVNGERPERPEGFRPPGQRRGGPGGPDANGAGGGDEVTPTAA